MDDHGSDRLEPLTFLIMLIILSALGYAAYENFLDESSAPGQQQQPTTQAPPPTATTTPTGDPVLVPLEQTQQ